jgi:hypothetical protein
MLCVSVYILLVSFCARFGYKCPRALILAAYLGYETLAPRSPKAFRDSRSVKKITLHWYLAISMVYRDRDALNRTEHRRQRRVPLACGQIAHRAAYADLEVIIASLVLHEVVR